MTKAVFLDRDGVLNRKREDYVKSVQELEFLRGAGAILRNLKDKGFLLVIITNQSAVNRGILSTKALEEINSALLAELKMEGCNIDAVYVCPHRPDESCRCRKPGADLLLKAAEDLHINLHSSWMVGDSDSDIEAGAKVGCRGIKIPTNSSLKPAVELILREGS